MGNNANRIYQDPKKNLEELMDNSSKHVDTLNEYFYLSTLEDLSETDADRLEGILVQASEDTLLSFLIDEADHVIAHHLNLINEDSINEQQTKIIREIIRKSKNENNEVTLSNFTLVEQKASQYSEIFHSKQPGNGVVTLMIMGITLCISAFLYVLYLGTCGKAVDPYQSQPISKPGELGFGSILDHQ